MATLLFKYRDGEAGGFSEEGITLGGITDNNTLSCFSTHLTSFAVLVDATSGSGDTVSNSFITTSVSLYYCNYLELLC